MESSPFAGYVKAAAFGILAFTVFVAFWQRTKVEDKIVALDQANQGIVDKINEMSAESRASAKETAKLRGRIESLIKVMNKRPVVVGTQPPTNGGGPAEDEPSTDIDDDEPMSGGEDWGWGLNAEIDQDLDPSRPVGAPGRYKNFLRLDPDPITHPEGVNRNGTLNFPWSSEPAGFNFILQTYATLSDYCEAYTMSSPASRHRKRPSSFNWSPDLCWRVEVSPDYKEFTLFFRKDAFWHKPPIDVRKYPHLAGKHQVTAHDLKFALDIITNPNTGKGAASLRSYYNELDGCDVIDDYTAVIRWKKTLWTNLSWSMGCYVMPRFVYEYDEGGNKYPKETVGQEFTNHWYDALRAGPVGHGPYRFVKYEEGKYIRLERWDEWFGFKD
ncbi:MAG: ABC transporter substrate-binding protein, partial [Planctomycetota bacterium]|nr:ABC transporter substrate-binding protein [Planctomycetota bacterium]